MPRKARLDAPGALHHIIVRGIERRKIFRDDSDRDNFLNRIGGILRDSQIRCFAWALMPNHFHLLLRTGRVPVSNVMRRLLTGYAVSFNLRHRRSGHLLQNRYKSILCQEDAYLLERVRSLGGWKAVKVLRGVGERIKGDERILCDGDFVESVLRAGNERLERRAFLQAMGYDFDRLVKRVAALFQMPSTEVLREGKYARTVEARSVLCFWANRDLGISTVELARRLKIAQPTVTQSVARGEKIVTEKQLLMSTDVK